LYYITNKLQAVRFPPPPFQQTLRHLFFTRPCQVHIVKIYRLVLLNSRCPKISDTVSENERYAVRITPIHAHNLFYRASDCSYMLNSCQDICTTIKGHPVASVPGLINLQKAITCFGIYEYQQVTIPWTKWLPTANTSLIDRC